MAGILDPELFLRQRQQPQPQQHQRLPDPDELAAAAPTTRRREFPDPDALAAAAAASKGGRFPQPVELVQPQTSRKPLPDPFDFVPQKSPNFVALPDPKIPLQKTTTASLDKPANRSFPDPTELPAKAKADFAPQSGDAARMPKLPNLKISLDRSMAGARTTSEDSPPQPVRSALPDPSMFELPSAKAPRSGATKTAEGGADPPAEKMAFPDPEELQQRKPKAPEFELSGPSISLGMGKDFDRTKTSSRDSSQTARRALPDPSMFELPSAKSPPSGTTKTAEGGADPPSAKMAFPDPTELQQRKAKAPEFELSDPSISLARESSKAKNSSADFPQAAKQALPDPSKFEPTSAKPTPSDAAKTAEGKDPPEAKKAFPDPEELQQRKAKAPDATLPDPKISLTKEPDTTKTLGSDAQSQQGAVRMALPDPSEMLKETKKTRATAKDSDATGTQRIALSDANSSLRKGPNESSDASQVLSDPFSIVTTPALEVTPHQSSKDKSQLSANKSLPDPTELLKRPKKYSTASGTTETRRADLPELKHTQEKTAGEANTSTSEASHEPRMSPSDPGSLKAPSSIRRDAPKVSEDKVTPPPKTELPDPTGLLATKKANSRMGLQPPAPQRETKTPVDGQTSEQVPQTMTPVDGQTSGQVPQTKTPVDGQSSGQVPQTKTPARSEQPKQQPAPDQARKDLLPWISVPEEPPDEEAETARWQPDEAAQPSMQRSRHSEASEPPPARQQPTMSPRMTQDQQEHQWSDAKPLGPLPSMSSSSRDLIAKMRASLMAANQQSYALDQEAVQSQDTAWDSTSPAHRGPTENGVVAAMTVCSPSFGSLQPHFRPPAPHRYQQTQPPSVGGSGGGFVDIAQEVRARLAAERASREADSELKQELMRRQLEVDRLTQSLDRLHRQNLQTKGYLVAALEKGDTQATELMQVMEEDRAMLRATRQENMELRSRVECDSRDIAGLESRLSSLEHLLQGVQQENRRLGQILQETAARLERRRDDGEDAGVGGGGRLRQQLTGLEAELMRLRREVTNQRLRAEIDATGGHQATPLQEAGRGFAAVMPEQQQLNQQTAAIPLTGLQRALQYQLPRPTPLPPPQQQQQVQDPPQLSSFLTARQQRRRPAPAPDSDRFRSSAVSASSILMGYDALSSFRSRSGDADRAETSSGTLHDYVTARELGASARRYADELIAKYTSQLQSGQ